MYCHPVGETPKTHARMVFGCRFPTSYVLAYAIRKMNETESITEAPKDCDNSGAIWEKGKSLFDYIKKQVSERRVAE